MILARAITAKSQISTILSLLLLMLLILVPFTLGTGDIINQTNTTIAQNETSLPPLGEQDYTTTFSQIYQEAITLEAPVYMYQTIQITNNALEELVANLDLYDYPQDIEQVYLDEALSMNVQVDGEEIAQDSTFLIELEAGETKEYIITYEYTPVHKEVVCVNKTVADLLPTDAIIQSSEVDMDEVVERTCNVRIHHDGEIHYYDINVPLDEFEPLAIEDIFYVEGDAHLKIEDDGSIALIQ